MGVLVIVLVAVTMTGVVASDPGLGASSEATLMPAPPTPMTVSTLFDLQYPMRRSLRSSRFRKSPNPFGGEGHECECVAVGGAADE